jgi:hypothetical protein
MKRLILLFLLLLCLSSIANASFTLTQISNVTTCTTTSATCDATVASTGTGHLLVVGMTGTINEPIVSVSGAGTWSLCASSSCFVIDNSNKSSDLAYCLSSTSGVTTITVTRGSTTSNTWKVAVWEISFTGASVALDTQGTRAQTTNSSSVVGVALTLTGSNDIIFQLIKAGATTVNNISSPYTRNKTSAESSWASSLDTVSGTAPTWTLNSALRAAMSALAFKEVTTTPKTKFSSSVN